MGSIVPVSRHFEFGMLSNSILHPRGTACLTPLSCECCTECCSEASCALMWTASCLMVQGHCTKKEEVVCPNHCEYHSECKKDACGDKKYCYKVVHHQSSVFAARCDRRAH